MPRHVLGSLCFKSVRKRPPWPSAVLHIWGFCLYIHVFPFPLLALICSWLWGWATAAARVLSSPTMLLCFRPVASSQPVAAQSLRPTPCFCPPFGSTSPGALPLISECLQVSYSSAVHCAFPSAFVLYHPPFAFCLQFPSIIWPTT